MTLWEFLDGRHNGVTFLADPGLVGARHCELRRGILYVSPAVESLLAKARRTASSSSSYG